MIIGAEAMKHLKTINPKSELEMAEASETPIIAVDRLPLSYDDLKPHLSTGVKLHIEVSARGKRLRHPILIELRLGLTLREFDIINYIVISLSGSTPRLIPWALSSPAIMRLAAYLRRYLSSSPSTLRNYIYRIKRFCEWVGCNPDDLIAKCLEAQIAMRSLLEDYIGELKAMGLAPGAIRAAIAPIQTMLKINGVAPPPIPLPRRRIVYQDRAPRPEELWRMIQVADLRGKVIVSMLALGGFRLGTLCRLRYYHVKEDLERGVIPVHIHIESEITKGKYCDYDTFIGREAVEYLKLYLDQRRRGSPSGKIPPEDIDDDSPLIRADYHREPRPLTRYGLYHIIRNLYIKAGLTEKRGGKFYTLRPHSIRKFFRTQLAAKGVPADYIEYMMGHKISTYHDIKMKGIEFLRQIYAAAGLSIKPKTHTSRIEMLKEIIRAWGMDPERILVKEALMEPHRTMITAEIDEERQTRTLAKALKEMLRRELLE